MDDLIKDFIQESRENLDRLDQDFVKLEGDPGNRELLKSIFRTIHTIKGTCGFLGFTKLEALTHAGENLLSLLRDGELNLTEECADVLLEMVDAVRNYLHEIETTEVEGAADTTELIGKLKKLQARNRAKGDAAPTPAAPVPQAPAQEISEEKSAPAESAAKETAALRKEAGPQPSSVAETPKPKQTKHEVMPKVEEIARGSKAGEPKDATIRVDVNLLEKQMNLVSELVLLRNRLLQLAVESNERNLNATVHGLNYVTSELRKNVMKTRMQPAKDPVTHIVHLETLLDERRAAKRTEEGKHPADKEKISAIVVRLEGSSNIILEVHRILGIAKVEIEKLTPPSRAGVRGSMVIQERVTELLDLPAPLKKSPSLKFPAKELVGAGTEQ